MSLAELEPGHQPNLLHSSIAARIEAIDVLKRGAGSLGRPDQNPHAGVTREVGLRSSLSLRFDRPFLDSLIRNGAFESTISIRGEYVRAGKAEKLEIPGYSGVGQDARRARITTLARHPKLLSRAMHELEKQLSDIKASIAARESDIAQVEVADTKRLAQLRDSIATGTRELAAVSDTEKMLLVSYDSLIQSRNTPTAPDSSDAPNASAKLRDLTTKLRNESARRASIDVRVSKAREDVAHLVQDAQRQGFNDARTIAIARVYLDASAELLTLTGRITGRSDSTMRELTARLLDRDASSLEALGRHLQTNFAELGVALRAATEAKAADRRQPIASLSYANDLVQEDLTRIASIAPTADFERTAASTVSAMLLNEFAEPTVSLPTTPVEPGDIVRLVITSAPPDNQPAREFSIHVRVLDFGFNLRTRDASALVRRRGVRSRTNERALETFLQAKKAGTLVVDDAVSYQPTIGAVLGWQWVPRNMNPGTAFIRWITPSVGLHVTTPQFGSHIYRIEADGGEVKVEERKNGLDVGLGALVGLWDDRVLFSWGRVITASDKKRFFSVGLSFVSLANGALSLTKPAQ